MNHRVPVWHISGNPVSLSPDSISLAGVLQPDESDVQELLWRDGTVVTQTYSQKMPRASTVTFSGEGAPFNGTFSKYGARESRTVVSATLSSSDPPPPYIQDDDMPSWLNHPFDDAFYRDLFLLPGDRTPQAPVPAPPEPREPATGRDSHASRARNPPSPSPLKPGPKVVNFSIFAKTAGLVGEVGPRLTDLVAGGSEKARLESTTEVDSCDTPPQLVGHRPLHTVQPPEPNDLSASRTETMELSMEAVRSGSERPEATIVSSKPMNRKRESRDSEEWESHHDEDGEADESVNGKRSKAKRRNRATEIHNLSERRRRDRINEKMRALQELLPRCNKADKASLLDEAIEYLKALQLQVQMMSVACSMPHMMFPAHNQWMNPMAIAIGMGMVAGSTSSTLPFSPVVPGAAQLCPALPMPSVRGMQVAPQPSKIESVSGSLDSLLSPSQPATLAEYQQYLSQVQMQVPQRMQVGEKVKELSQAVNEVDENIRMQEEKPR